MIQCDTNFTYPIGNLPGHVVAHSLTELGSCSSSFVLYVLYAWTVHSDIGLVRFSKYDIVMSQRTM